MSYIEAIIALFVVVDPLGNVPFYLHVAEQVPRGQSQKAFNTAVVVSVFILLVFSLIGNVVLGKVFGIELADLQIAGGMILVVVTINNLLFGTIKKTTNLENAGTAQEFGCVPLACPLLAGPGAMVTSINILKSSGVSAVLLAIFVVFGVTWLIMFFVTPLYKILGRLVCVVISKIMYVFVAAIGVNMIITGLQYYWK